MALVARQFAQRANPKPPQSYGNPNRNVEFLFVRNARLAITALTVTTSFKRKTE